MTNKLSDLKLGNIYYICFVPNAIKAKKIKLIGFINEFKNETDLYIEFINKGQVLNTAIPMAKEIGIGETKSEAKNNYGRFKYENIKGAFKSLEELKKKKNLK